MTDILRSIPPVDNKDRFYYGYVIVAAACLVMIVCMCFHFAFGVFFKPILNEFGWTRSMTSGAFSLSWIVSGVLAIPLGGLNDRFGSRVVVTVCGIVLFMGYMLMSQVQQAWQLYLVYGVIIGAGLSFVIPLMSTIARWFSKQRNLMTGILLAGGGIASLIGPPIADSLILAFDWRTSYIIAGIVILVVMIPTAQLFKRPPSTLPANQEKVNDHPVVQPTSTNFTAKQAMATRQFWMAFFMFFCLGFCLYSIQIHLAPHATDLGFSTTAAAVILAVMGGSSIVGRLLLGGVGDKIGNKLTLIIAFCLISLSLVWLIFSMGELALLIFAVTFGIGYGGGVSTQSPMVAYLFGLKSHGLVLGICSLGFTIGAAIAPIITGYVYDLFNSYQLAFAIGVTIAILGLLLTMMLKPLKFEQ
jgi:MFS family permease